MRVKAIVFLCMGLSNLMPRYSPEKGKSFSFFQTVSRFSSGTRKFFAYGMSEVHYYYLAISFH